MTKSPIRVLIVDDSALFRKVLAQGISSDPDFELVGAAADVDQARQFMKIRRPDVISLDIEMPKTDGLTFLREEISQDAIPTVIVSSRGSTGIRVTLDALQAGAVDVVAKPQMTVGQTAGHLTATIRHRLKSAREAHVRAQNGHVVDNISAVAPCQTRSVPARVQNGDYADWIFAIGASTGGVQALGSLLSAFPADAPATVIVQHMPEGFTNAFARRLNDTCEIEIREARHGDTLRQGLALLAPGGDRHMVLRPTAGGCCVVLNEGEQVCYSQPSVDVLFASAANYAAPRMSAALLTGMGRDGADGLGMIRRVGGRTFAQDEASSVVFGMPGAAWDKGSAESLVPLSNMASTLLGSVGVPPVPMPEVNEFSMPHKKGYSL